jgi:hypothetical protein
MKESVDKDIIGKKKVLEHELTKFQVYQTNIQKLDYLSKSPLGLYLFSRFVLSEDTKEKIGFLRQIELDVRGECTLRNNLLFLEVGEIKTGQERQKAIKQLLKRLAILGYAGLVLSNHTVIYDRYSFLFFINFLFRLR